MAFALIKAWTKGLEERTRGGIWLIASRGGELVAMVVLLAKNPQICGSLDVGA